jgi:hypothetical protein
MPKRSQVKTISLAPGMNNDAMNEGVLNTSSHSRSWNWRNWAHSLILLLSLSHLDADQVIFSEIMYHPRQGTDSAWIECVNLTATPFDCAEWTLHGKSLEYTFPPFEQSNSIFQFHQTF